MTIDHEDLIAEARKRANLEYEPTWTYNLSGHLDALADALESTTARLREAERRNIRLLDEAVKREARVMAVEDFVTNHYLDTSMGAKVLELLAKPTKENGSER